MEKILIKEGCRADTIRNELSEAVDIVKVSPISVPDFCLFLGHIKKAERKLETIDKLKDLTEKSNDELNAIVDEYAEWCDKLKIEKDDPATAIKWLIKNKLKEVLEK